MRSARPVVYAKGGVPLAITRNANAQYAEVCELLEKLSLPGPQFDRWRFAPAKWRHGYASNFLAWLCCIDSRWNSSTNAN